MERFLFFTLTFVYFITCVLLLLYIAFKISYIFETRSIAFGPFGVFTKYISFGT